MSRSRTLRDLLAGARLRNVFTFVVIGGVFVAAMVFAHEDIDRHIDLVEAWIQTLGPWGILLFVGMFVVGTSLFVPETVLSIMAGAIFGLVWGLAAVFAGSLLAATLQYAISQSLLQARIQRLLAARPALTAIQRAVRTNEFRLQVLLRLTPLNPATISYALGAAGVRYGGFMVACLAFSPHLLIDVYFGYAGRHFARIAGGSVHAETLHNVIVVGGLIATAISVVVVSRMAYNEVTHDVDETVEAGTEPEEA